MINYENNQLGFCSDKVVFCELLSSMFEINDIEKKEYSAVYSTPVQSSN